MKIMGWSFVMIIFMACSEDSPVQPRPQEVRSDTLHTASSFPIGAAIDPNYLRTRAKYQAVLTREFNSITPENAMKLGWIHPQQNTYSFADADYIVSFAQNNGNKRIHGHVLAWHAFQEVTWIKNFSGNTDEWEAMLKDHIQTVVTHFKGKVTGWDVVNEAFQDNGEFRNEDTNLTDATDDGSIWVRKLRTGYIERAFQYAHEADPDVLLFYNDYGQEASVAKLNAIKAMVVDFQERGIPIHGIGLQMHIGLNAPDAGIVNALKELANTGLLIHISELDINMCNWVKNPALQLTDELKQQQKVKYKNLVLAYRANVPEAQQYGITTWNVGDSDSWLRSFIQPNEWPLLFDDGYNPKPAYYGFLEGLKE